MAIPQGDLRASAVGTGSSINVALDFVFWESSSIKAFKYTTATGVGAAFTDFTVMGGNGSTGMAITTDNHPTTSETVKFYLEMPLEQQESQNEGTGYSATSIERADDKNAQRIKQLSEEIARCVKVPVNETSADDLPAFASRAGKVPSFDENGNLVATINAAPLADVGDAVATAEAAAATATTQAATATTQAGIATTQAGIATTKAAEAAASAAAIGQDVSTSGSPTFAGLALTGNADLNSNKITELGDATADTDALNRQSADARYLRLAQALGDLPDKVTARLNLGVYSQAETAALAGLKYAAQSPGYYSPGTGPALVIPAHVATDIGQGDFTLILEFCLSAWQPVADVVLYDNTDSNLGLRISLLGTSASDRGKIRVQFGNGTNLTTYDYTSTAANTLASGVGRIALSADRSGTLLVVINGQQLGTGIDISASREQSLTSAGTGKLLSTGSTHYAGGISGGRAILMTEALGVAALAADFREPDYLFRSGSAGRFRSYYNAGTAVDSWSAYGGSMSVVGGKLRYTSATGGAATVLRNNVFVAGNDYRVRLKVVGNVTEVAYLNVVAGATSSTVYMAFPVVMDGVTVNAIDFTISLPISGWTNAAYLKFNLSDDSAYDAYVAATGDYADFWDIQVDRIGPAQALDMGHPGPTKPDLTTNRADAYVPAASTVVNPPDMRVVELRWTLTWAASASAQSIAASGQDVMQDGDVIEELWLMSSATQHWIVGDEVDSDRYVTETELTAGQKTKMSLSASSPDGANFELTATPMDGAAAPEPYTGTLTVFAKVRRAL